MNRPFRVGAAIAVLLAGLFTPPALALEEPRPVLRDSAISALANDLLPLRIEQALHRQGGSGRSTGLAEAEVVRLFYHGRAYRPAWIGGVRASELIAAVDASRDHGLTPADFAIDALRKAQAAGGGDPDAIVRRELLFTDALARLARQMHSGKVDPYSLYSIWNFSPVPGAMERARMLKSLLEAPSLGAALAALAPQDESYRALQKALSRFSALAAMGGWQVVPEGPTLRPGERDPRVRALRARLHAEGWIAASDVAAAGGDPARYDDALKAAVERFQRAHGLAADAAVGRLTLAALNVSAAERVGQIRVNLERARWIARDMTADRLVVDITGFDAALHLGGALAWSSKVVVGRPARETPVLLDHVQHLVLNPKWVVPPTILREDVIPGVIRSAAYLDEHQMRVVDRSGRAVDPALIDWADARRSGFPYRIVQQSGADGALGQIKFSLSNRYAIYMHDTPSRSLFRKPARAFSSGCVRLEKPRELALLLLDDPVRWSAEGLDAAIATGRTQVVPVQRRVTVMLLYRTAAIDETGAVSFRTDLYDEDGRVLAALDAGTGL